MHCKVSIRFIIFFVYNKECIKGSDCKLTYKNRPLVQRLVEFKNRNLFSFHVPGHKNGTLSGLPEQLRSALAYDFTELTGLDDLHQPAGVIQVAEQKLTTLYQADKSFFLVNGSTVGNLAMVYATCRENDIVIVQRNAHKSIFNALELTGARPVFVTPRWDENTKAAGTITESQVRKALTLYPEAKAVILTSPTYYGAIAEELKEIIAICHAKGLPVLVDEAHGAHFVIGKPFPKSALTLGADVVVHSAHKTLPAMTMASFLHVKSTLVSIERVAHYLQILQSSSPSYLLMASLDDAREYVASFTVEATGAFLENRKDMINRLTLIVGLEIVESTDPLKLMIRAKGTSGFELQQVLEAEGVYPELADPYQVLFVLPLVKQAQGNRIQKIILKIERAVIALENGEKNGREEAPAPVLIEDISEPRFIARELEKLDVEWINFERAIGQVAAATVTPYPPGIPLLLAGERISERHIASLTELARMQAKFQGTIRMKEKKILVVKNDSEE